MRKAAQNHIKLFAMMLLFLLNACDGAHNLVYNMTSSPIDVTFSAAAIKHSTITVQPGTALQVFGGPLSPKVTELIVIDASGAKHDYSSFLTKLRPTDSLGDHWAYSSAGLYFLKN
jgi:hypothetical protein